MDTNGPAIIRDIDTGIGPDEQTGSNGGEDGIRCPVCGWTPGNEHLWMCHCGHQWNTFDSGGLCPRCLTQWKFTMCPACQLWSPHSDWYKK